MPGFGAIGRFPIAVVTTGGTASAEFIGPDKYMLWLSEPVRFLPGLRAPQQAAFFFDPQPFPSFSWFASLTEPVRAPPRSPAAMAPTFFFDPQPFVSFAWFEALGEPIRARPRSPAAMAPTFFFQPSPVVSFGWFGSLAEPVRTRPALKTGENPAFFWQPSPSPFVASGWFEALSEPVRTLPGLKAGQQQFLAWPPRLLPTPTSFATMTLQALETKDSMSASARWWNRVAAGEVGIAVQFPWASGGQVGLAPIPATTAGVGLPTDPTVGSGGSAVTPITSAKVSIRIV